MRKGVSHVCRARGTPESLPVVLTRLLYSHQQVYYLMAKSEGYFGLPRGSTKSHTYQVSDGKQISDLSIANRIFHVITKENDGM